MSSDPNHYFTRRNDYENQYEKNHKICGSDLAATGVVALSALVASGAAVGAIIEGAKSARETVKKIMAEQPEADAAEEVAAENIEAFPDSENQENFAN